MAFLDDLKNVFSTKTPEQIYAEGVLKDIRHLENRTKILAEMSSQLGMCERKFENIIRISRLNAIQRRAAQVGDASEKKRIHDAVVGLLAVQEARFELSSITTSQDLEYSMKRLSSILRQMYRMDHYVSVTSGDLKKGRRQGPEFDNTVESTLLTERADRVDETLVERIIQGESVEDCMRSTSGRTVPTAPAVSAADGSGQPLPDFADQGTKTTEADIDFLLKQAGQDF